MGSSDTIVETTQGSIKIITYNRPTKKNAIDVDMYKRMAEILNSTAMDENITVAVLTGMGDYYSSGNDLVSSFERAGNDNVVTTLKNFVDAFITFPKTLIAIVNGPAIGIAATTLALFDLVFAVENAFFYTPFTKLGLVAEGCSSFTFPRLLGDRKAAEMLMFNHKMGAKEALDCGFINYIYKPEELQTKVWNKIIEVSKLPKCSLEASKQLVRSHIKDNLLRVNVKEIEELQKIWSTQEYMDILLEFLESKQKKNKSKL